MSSERKIHVDAPKLMPEQKEREDNNCISIFNA